MCPLDIYTAGSPGIEDRKSPKSLIVSVSNKVNFMLVPSLAPGRFSTKFEMRIKLFDSMLRPEEKNPASSTENGFILRELNADGCICGGENLEHILAE